MVTTTTSISSTTTQTTADGPVLAVITKRLRSLRKKLNRITQMQHTLSLGKTLNSEQLDVLRTKPAIVTLIDELEKLRSPLAAALREEISAVQSPRQQSNGNNVDDEIEKLRSAEIISSVQSPPQQSNGNSDANVDDVIMDLVNLMYFGNLFDVRPPSEFTSLMLTRTHERGCCLTYDYVTDDDEEDRGGLLGEKYLDLISGLRGLMVSKPVHSVLSHRDALHKCVRHAKFWLDKSDFPIGDSDSGVTCECL